MGFPRRPNDRWRLPGTWREDSSVVDGYRPDGVPWPVETTRFAYLTPFGGFTSDLPEGMIGVNRQALVENTELQPGDEVTLSVFERGRPVPLVLRPTFEIVAIDFAHPDAFLQSVDGEAVLSQAEGPALDAKRGLDALESGARIILNGVLAARLRDTRAA